jgi:hypothetical protein
LLPVFTFEVTVLCETFYGACPPQIEYTSLAALVYTEFKIAFSNYAKPIFSIYPFVGILLSYLISSFSTYKISRISGKDLEEFRLFFRFTKVKLIISFLGWLTIGYIFLHYLSGVYGGTTNFPPYLTEIWKIYEVISIAILPFTLITFLLLFPTNVVMTILFAFITKIPINITGGYGIHPAYLTTGGMIFNVFALFFEWYYVACLIVLIYEKLRKKF